MRGPASQRNRFIYSHKFPDGEEHFPAPAPNRRIPVIIQTLQVTHVQTLLGFFLYGLPGTIAFVPGQDPGQKKCPKCRSILSGASDLDQYICFALGYPTGGMLHVTRCLGAFEL
jgi:hypothetical protein